jgi:hypothetical protein
MAVRLALCEGPVMLDIGTFQLPFLLLQFQKHKGIKIDFYLTFERNIETFILFQ